MAFISPSTLFFEPPAAEPKPENSTLESVLFIDLHIMTVSMTPLAPTREPATMSTLFCITKPAAQAARPERELSSDITTGISPPPMGMTATMPRTSDRTIAAAIISYPTW